MIRALKPKRECTQTSWRGQPCFQGLENWLLIIAWPAFCRTWISLAHECCRRQKRCSHTQARSQCPRISLWGVYEYMWKDPHFIRELSQPLHSSQDQIPLLPLSECWWQLHVVKAWWRSASIPRVTLWQGPCTASSPQPSPKWAKGTRTLVPNFCSLLFL